MKIIFLLLTVFPLASIAAPKLTPQNECTSIDLRSQFLGEVRNQKEVAWCYAFTGADMIDHLYETSEKTSAADMAISYNETKLGRLIRWVDRRVISRNNETIQQLPHQKGLNKFSLQKAMHEGWCPERIFPSESWVMQTRTENGWAQSQVDLDVAMKNIYTLHQDRKSLTLENLPYYYSFKNVGPAEFLTLIKSPRLESFYTGLRKAACQNDRQAFETKSVAKMSLRHPKVFRTISKNLSEGRLVGMDYDNRLLKDANHRGVSFAKLHTSSFIGRRWNQEKKACELLIRNSYGDQCDEKYDQGYECDAGNVWIDENTIYKNLLSIVYLLPLST